MHLFGLRGYGLGTYAIIVAIGGAVLALLKLLREDGMTDVPGWAAQLILWWTIAAANISFSRWLDRQHGGRLIIDPDDPKRLVVARPEQHFALWIPVRHWSWIFILIGLYGSLYAWSTRP